MKAFLLVVLLSSFAKSVNAEKSSYKPCCHPETMEGSARQYYSMSTGLIQDVKFHLDYRNLKYAFEYPSNKPPTKEIALCDSQGTCIDYIILESQEYCIKQKIYNFNFIDGLFLQCIPNNATSQKMVRIGSDEKQSSLLLQNWMFTYYEYRHRRLVTDVDCFPVVDFMNLNLTTTEFIEQVYFDTTKTIKDPSVFTPPSYCHEANDMHEDSKYQHKMFSSLFSTRK